MPSPNTDGGREEEEEEEVGITVLAIWAATDSATVLSAAPGAVVTVAVVASCDIHGKVEEKTLEVGNRPELERKLRKIENFFLPNVY